MLPRICAAALIAAALSSSMAANQDDERRLMQNQLRLASGGGPPELLDPRDGPLPATFPRDLLMPETDVLLWGGSDHGTVVVAIARKLSGDDVTRAEQVLLARGWIVGMGMPDEGFVSARLDKPLSMCRGTDFASVRVTPRNLGGFYVIASLASDPRRACSGRPNMLPDVRLPALEPPAGVKQSGAGGSSGRDAWETRATVTGGRSVADLADAYIAQLVAQGWKLEERVPPSGSWAVVRLSSKTTAGEPLFGMLMITPIGNGTCEALFRLVRTQR
jgi:hypothetical protein